jgi:hypothetical protein
MLTKPLARNLGSAVLIAILALSIATPALAFDGRGGDNVSIPAGEVVNDDLYVSGTTLVMNGTVKGDLVVFAKTITINGTVDGDVIAAGQDVIINGTVGGAVRIAGAALYIGGNAKIGADIVGAGASMEVRKGSTVGRDVIFAGGQALLSGAITRNVNVASGGLQLGGTIGGNLTADVGNPDQNHGGGPRSYIPNSTVNIPDISMGLTIDPEAKIGGNLDYTSSKTFNIAAGVVAGKVTRTEPKVDENIPKPPTMTDRVINGGLDVIRMIITLLLFGLLLGSLFPGFMKTATGRIQSAPLPALGEGILSIAVFFFALFALVIAMIIGGILFGVLTLGQITGTIIVLGLLAIFALILGFVLVTSFVAQIVVSTLGGRLILARVRPELAENKYWPLVIGVVIFAILAALPLVGWLVNLLVVLFGLGALWYIGRAKFTRTPTVPPIPVA